MELPCYFYSLFGIDLLFILKLLDGMTFRGVEKNFSCGYSVMTEHFLDCGKGNFFCNASIAKVWRKT